MMNRQEWMNHMRIFASECRIRMTKGDNWKERYSTAFKHAEWYKEKHLSAKNPGELYEMYYNTKHKVAEMSPQEKDLMDYCERNNVRDNYYNIEDLAYFLAIKAYYKPRLEKILEIKDQLFKVKSDYYPAETGDDRDMEMIHWINAAIGNLERIDNFIRAK